MKKNLTTTRASSKAILVLFAFLVLLLASHIPQPVANAAGELVSLSVYQIREGNDFATLNLRDPWDMDQYSDVSMYINESNVAIHLQNIQVSDDTFSARSLGNDAQFHVLFPGYQSSIPAGKTGARYPIRASFHCLFTLMQVNSGVPSDDEVRAWWFEDNTLAGGQFGSDRLVGFPIQSGRQLYAADLGVGDVGDSGTAWTFLSEWQGLRIDPTTKSGVDFAVDWVRLTDCAEVPVTVSWSGITGAVDIWAGNGSAQPDFRVPDGPLSLEPCTPTSCVMDVQGWQPGTYFVGVKRLSDGLVFWAPQPLVIDPVPIVRIARPSFTSGSSVVWRMDGPGDIVSGNTICVTYIFDNGELDLVTQPPGAQAGNCVSSGNSDPQVVLRQSGNLDTAAYRYLTFRISMDGAWQDVNLGWILRWIWSPYANCFLVSNDIPFDVGWQTLTIDLHDPFEGFAEDSAAAPGVNCPTRHWTDFPATYVRFDPNENRTTEVFHQRVDWIRLSRMDRIAEGGLFPILLDSTENVQDLVLSFYYTTDPRTNPKQNGALIASSSPPPPAGPYVLFLPAVLEAAEPSEPGYPTYLWDTTGVGQGQYYVCVEANDGLNSAVFCSDAPVSVE